MTRLRDPLAYLQPAKTAEDWAELPVVAPRCAVCHLTCWTPPCPCADIEAPACNICGDVGCVLQPEAVPPW